MKLKIKVIVATLALAAVAHADVSTITAVGPVEGWWTGGANGSNKTMNASSTITDASGTYSGFTGISSVGGSYGSTFYNGSIATGNPIDAAAAITDNRIDTGIANPSDNTQFWLGETVSSGHVVAMIWNGYVGTGGDWYDQPDTVTAYDSLGTQVGLTVAVADLRPDWTVADGNNFGLANLTAPINGGRGMYGVTVDIADFGGTASDIAYISIAGAAGSVNETDMMYVGTAIPEPATIGLLTMFGTGLMFFRRKFMI